MCMLMPPSGRLAWAGAGSEWYVRSQRAKHLSLSSVRATNRSVSPTRSARQSGDEVDGTRHDHHAE
jgi:hypothetical protein